MSGIWIQKQRTFRINDTLYKGNRAILTSDDTVQVVGTSKSWNCSQLCYGFPGKFNVGSDDRLWKIRSVNTTFGINSTRFLFDDTKWTNGKEYPVVISFVGNRNVQKEIWLPPPRNTGYSLLYTHYECFNEEDYANYRILNININLTQLAAGFITDGEMMLEWDLEITTDTLVQFYMNSRQVLKEKLADTCFSFHDSGFKRKAE